MQGVQEIRRTTPITSAETANSSSGEIARTSSSLPTEPRISYETYQQIAERAYLIQDEGYNQVRKKNA